MRNFTFVGIQKLRNNIFIYSVLLFIIFSLYGCTFPTSKTKDIKQVHDTYREEFVRLIVPSTGTRATLATGNSFFTNTLAEIRDFKVKYGEKSIESQHLNVLEGMIYLQSNQYGMARLMIKDINTVATTLKSRKGKYVRDQLFAQSFNNLLDGWVEITKMPPDDKVLEKAADGINIILNDDIENYSDVDNGAVYLATSAAIFYSWVCDINPSKDNKIYHKKGKDLIGKFLSKSEKTAAGNSDIRVPSNTPRLRYIQWYKYLSNKSQ